MNRPTREEAEEAVRTLIRWAGDDPERKGLIDTPKRVVKSYEEFFRGYREELNEEICRTFFKTPDYDDIIMLKDIRLESYCEHHMVPMIGAAHVAYIPDQKIIGLSKLAKIVDFHAKRLQIQERMVVEIAETIVKYTGALGAAVVIDSSHQCLTTRGVHKTEALMRTMHFTGQFKDKALRAEFINTIRGRV